MNFAPSFLPLIIPIMPVGHPSTSRTWWNCLSSIQLYIMNWRRATSLCYAQPTNSHWRQRTSRMSTATPNYKQKVVDYFISIMITQIWLHCTCLQVLILWGSLTNSRGSGATQFTHRTSWGITLFTTTFHQRCWEFLECDPFLETGNELIAIDTRAVIELDVVMSLGQIQGVGEALHESYVQARIL